MSEYKSVPVDKIKLEAMKDSAPTVYKDMVKLYGIDSVEKNIMADYIIMTEDDNIIYPAIGKPRKITKELIQLAFNRTKANFTNYVKNAVNKGKEWLQGEYIGYVPIGVMHYDELIARQGYVIGDSFRIEVSDNGKWVLKATFVYISPRAKFDYLNGLLRYCSPKLRNDFSIKEVSIVEEPAQETNTAMGAGVEPVLEDNEELVNTIILNEEPKTMELDELQKAKFEAEQEKIDNINNIKINVVNNAVDSLLNKGIISSFAKDKYASVLMALSAGEIPMVTEAMQDLQSASPFMNGPCRVHIKGEIMLNKDQAYTQFIKEHPELANDKDKATAEFTKHYDTLMAMSAKDGNNGEIVDIDNSINSVISLMKSGALTEEQKQGIILAMSSSGATAKVTGNPITPGGIEEPNNTAYAAKDNPAEGVVVPSTEKNDKYISMLEENHTNLKSKNEALEKELQMCKSKLETIKTHVSQE